MNPVCSSASVISTTEAGLWHPICTDYRVMAHYDIAWQNVHWSTQAQNANRIVTLLSYGHWASASSSQTWHYRSLWLILNVFAVMLGHYLDTFSWKFYERLWDDFLSILLYWHHKARRPKCSFAVIMLMAISIDFCCLLVSGPTVRREL